jgi:hypothetical protein
MHQFKIETAGAVRVFFSKIIAKDLIQAEKLFDVHGSKLGQ